MLRFHKVFVQVPRRKKKIKKKKPRTLCPGFLREGVFYSSGSSGPTCSSVGGAESVLSSRGSGMSSPSTIRTYACISNRSNIVRSVEGKILPPRRAGGSSRGGSDFGESHRESLHPLDSGHDGIDDGIVSVDGIDATRISGGRADLSVDAIVTSGHRNLEVDGIGKIGIAVGDVCRGFEVDPAPLTDEVHRKTDEVSVCEDSSGVSETVAVSEDDTDQLSEDGIDFPNLGRIGVETPKPLDGRISEHDRESILNLIE